MQHPTGYVIRGGRAELVDFVALVTQKYAIFKILHTVSGAFVLSGFFVMGIAAYHILRKNQTAIFSKSFKLALVFSLIFSIFEVIHGHVSGTEISKLQPAKLAAIESHWETGPRAPFNIIAIPDRDNERNSFAISLPGVLSLLVHNSLDAEVVGLKDFPRDERPPILLPFYSFRVMVGLGFLFILLTLIGVVRINKLETSRWYLKLMLMAIPLPYIACEAGWVVAEVGRQPWIVHGLMKTSEAVSPIAGSQVAVTLVAFIIVYSLLGLAAFYLMIRYAKKGI